MINPDDLRTLMQESGESVFSLFLNVDASVEENQAAKPAWHIFAENALSNARKEAGEENAAWQDIEQRVKNYINAYSPSSKGLALFYGPDTEQVYELPVPPHENGYSYGTVDIAPLLWLIDEYEQYLIVLVDSEEAQLLTTYLGDIDREEALASDRFTFDFRQKTIMPRPTGTQGDTGQQATAGSHRDRFDDKMDEFIAKFHRDVADRVREWLQQNGPCRVVLGGDEKAANSVNEHLHEDASRHVVAVMGIPFQLNDNEVMNRILPTALNHERSEEMDLVESVINAAKTSGGRGALGQEDVGQALQMQQIETLVVPWPLNDDHHDMTVQAFRNGSQIELVHGAAASKLENEGGIGARLYYSIEATQ